MRYAHRIAGSVGAAWFAAACAALLPAQQRAPAFLTVTDAEGRALEGAEVTCVFTPSTLTPGREDVVRATTDARGRARCDLAIGSLYVAWAIGPPDAAGARFVSEVQPLVAAGRIVELAAFDRWSPRRVTVDGLDAWRAAGARSLRFRPDVTQDVAIDLPLPASAVVDLPPGPNATALLGACDASGELMVATPITLDRDAVALAPPMQVDVDVRTERGEPLAAALLTCDVLSPPAAGFLFTRAPTLHRRIAGRTAADGRARFWVPIDAKGTIVGAEADGRVLQHQWIGKTGALVFGLPPTRPHELQLVGFGAHAQVTAVARWNVPVDAGRSAVELRVDGEPLDDQRFHLRIANGAFEPRVRLAGTVPAAIVWDAANDAAPTRIDAGTLRTLDVRIVDPDGGPIAAAIAAGIEPPSSSSVRWSAALATDLAGRATLWVPNSACGIFATTQTHWGFMTVAPDAHGEVTLRLQPLATMQIGVADDSAPVAGARAALVRWSGRADDTMSRILMLTGKHYIGLGRSDADGRLTVRVPALPDATVQLRVVGRAGASEPFAFAANTELRVHLDAPGTAAAEPKPRR